jgi:hypothetical protein
MPIFQENPLAHTHTKEKKQKITHSRKKVLLRAIYI